MSPPKKQAAKPRHDNGFTRVEEWNNMKKGDACGVDGQVGTWTFLCHVTNRDQNEWVDVIGGKPGHSAFRSFPTDLVHPLGPRSLGVRVKVARELLKWTRKDLAVKTDLTVSQIARVEYKGYGTKKEEAALRAALDIHDGKDV